MATIRRANRLDNSGLESAQLETLRGVGVAYLKRHAGDFAADHEDLIQKAMLAVRPRLAALTTDAERQRYFVGVVKNKLRDARARRRREQPSQGWRAEETIAAAEDKCRKEFCKATGRSWDTLADAVRGYAGLPAVEQPDWNAAGEAMRALRKVIDETIAVADRLGEEGHHALFRISEAHLKPLVNERLSDDAVAFYGIKRTGDHEARFLRFMDLKVASVRDAQGKVVPLFLHRDRAKDRELAILEILLGLGDEASAGENANDYIRRQTKRVRMARTRSRKVRDTTLALAGDLKSLAEAGILKRNARH